MKNKRCFVSFGLILSLGLGTGGCATYKMHPEFKERRKSIKTVSALPPDVEVYRLTFGGKKEPMYELYPQVSKGTMEALEGVFTEKGYRIQPLDLSEAALEAEPGLRATLYTLHEVYKKTLVDIQKRRQKKFIYSLGAQVNSLADRANADALLLVKWEAYKKSGGEIAKDMIKTVLIAAATLGNVIAIMPPSYATAHFALVDGNTGEILWYHHNLNNIAVNVERHDQLTVAISRMVQPFPISKELEERRKAKRERHKRPKTNISADQPISPTPVPVPAPMN